MCVLVCVFWCSGSQHQVTTSSTLAEYAAIGDCAKEALFISSVLPFIEPCTRRHRIFVRKDNKGAIRLPNIPFGSARLRHIHYHHNSLRELAAKHDIRIEHVETKLQNDNVLTKPLEVKLL